jgi:hypothetical protein
MRHSVIVKSKVANKNNAQSIVAAWQITDPPEYRAISGSYIQAADNAPGTTT